MILIIIYVFGTLFYMYMAYRSRHDKTERMIFSACIPVAVCFAFISATYQGSFSIIRFFSGYMVGLGTALAAALIALVFALVMESY